MTGYWVMLPKSIKILSSLLCMNALKAIFCIVYLFSFSRKILNIRHAVRRSWKHFTQLQTRSKLLDWEKWDWCSEELPASGHSDGLENGGYVITYATINILQIAKDRSFMKEIVWSVNNRNSSNNFDVYHPETKWPLNYRILLLAESFQAFS